MIALDLDRIVGGNGGPREVCDAVYEHEDGTIEILCTRPRRIHVELIGGGGGGGGVECRQHVHWSGGGGTAGHYVFAEMVIEPGRYLLDIGNGGRGGRCTCAGHPVPDSESGGDTVLRDAASGRVHLHAGGGRGGRANVGNATDTGESGGHVETPDGRLIARGGAGGAWDANGTSGQFPGAGGGGHGRYEGPQPGSGGDGASGRVRIWVLEDEGRGTGSSVSNRTVVSVVNAATTKMDFRGSW